MRYASLTSILPLNRKSFPFPNILQLNGQPPDTPNLKEKKNSLVLVLKDLVDSPQPSNAAQTFTNCPISKFRRTLCLAHGTTSMACTHPMDDTFPWQLGLLDIFFLNNSRKSRLNIGTISKRKVFQASFSISLYIDMGFQCSECIYIILYLTNYLGIYVGTGSMFIFEA